MSSRIEKKGNIDWTTLITYLTLVLIGWITVYSAGYHPEDPGIFNFKETYGKQFVWMCFCTLMGVVIFNIDSKFFSSLAFVYYGISLVLLIVVYFTARDINGAKAWIDLGFFRLQPSEFCKFTTALALSKFLSELNITLENKKHLITTIFIILIPFALILLQHDMGSALVFTSFVFMMHRLGLTSWVIISGFYAIFLSVIALIIKPFLIILFLLAIFGIVLYVNLKKRNFKQILNFFIFVWLASGVYVFSVDYMFNKLEKHQKDRINVMLGKGGNDWNIRQSRIALGSGQLLGKGFLKGTQSKGNFLPAKETDFIFCTIGEEWGFLGCFIVIGLYVILLYRIILLAEKQKSKFAKIYGYCIVGIIYFHFFINIGMTVGLVPVIGIPLPGVSYGGSSLISFTLLILVFLKFDSERNKY